MTWLDRLVHRVFGRRRIYDDLAEEIRAHLDEKTDALVARGMSPADARAAARRAFGNVTAINERGRDAWQWPTLESTLLDVRFALRQIRRARAVSAIIVVTLAVGIAATSTVFSWARSVLLDPLPGAGDPARVVALETTSSDGSWTPTSWLDYTDLRTYIHTFSGMAASLPASLALGSETHADRAWGEIVSANFFDVLRVRPALGAFFPGVSDDAQGGAPRVVISDALWQRRWHGDSSVIGRVVQINRFGFTIAGVAPASFHGSMPGQQIDLWLPASMLGQIVPTGGWWLRDRGTRTFRVLARLRDGVTMDEAQADVDALTRVMRQRNGAVAKGMHGRVLPLWESHWGVQDALRAPLLVLLAACGLVLLIVCANTASLLLARASARGKELGLRVALGAPRARLVRQLLTEASVLAVAGAALGLVATVWLARSVTTLVPTFGQATLLQPRVDGGVLAFTAALAVAVTLIAGVAPALHGSRDALGGALHDARGGIGSTRSTRTRRLLVVAEMALAVVSLVGAGSFYESIRNSAAVAPGFDATHVAMASVSVTLAGYDSARGDAFLAEVADRLRREPGVTAASYTDYVPLSVGAGAWEDLRVEGYTPQANENMKLYRAAIGPEYFHALGIPFVDGRDFTLGDDSAHAAVMIVNESFVRRYLAGRAALGVRVHGWGRWFTIVGVVRDSKFYRVTDPPTPYFYVPARQVYRPEYGYTFLVRTAGSVDQAVQTIQRDVRAADPTVPVFNAMPLATYTAGPLESARAAMRLLALLAVIAAGLAAIGLYGVVSFAVAQRTKEFGVRIALGAQPGDVVRVVVGQAGQLLAGGLVLGVAAALLVTRGLSSMLYGVSAGDAMVCSGATAAMVAIAVVATLMPARRALRVDPLTALRM